MSTTPDRLLTSHDVGRMLQMDPSSIVKWVNDGILPAYRTPGGHRRIKSSDLRAFLHEHGMYVPPELEGGRKSVLVIDDDPALLKSLVRGMKSYGEQLDVRTAQSGIDGLVQVGAQKPDVLVVDVNMEGLDGFEVCERLRANPVTASVRIVIVTGKRTKDVEVRAKNVGAAAVLEKPFTAAALAELVLGEARAGAR